MKESLDAFFEDLFTTNKADQNFGAIVSNKKEELQQNLTNLFVENQILSRETAIIAHKKIMTGPESTRGVKLVKVALP